jgi:hypothetical protein
LSGRHLHIQISRKAITLLKLVNNSKSEWCVLWETESFA